MWNLLCCVADTCERKWQKTKMSVSLVMSYIQRSAINTKGKTGPPMACLLHSGLHPHKQHGKVVPGNFVSEATNHSKQIDHELATGERGGEKQHPSAIMFSKVNTSHRRCKWYEDWGLLNFQMPSCNILVWQLINFLCLSEFSSEQCSSYEAH